MMMRKFIIFILIFAISGSVDFLYSIKPAQAVVPPVNSPLVLGQHPRLFIAPGNLSSFKTLIINTYATEFQSFITGLDNAYSASASSKAAWEQKWGAMNYAFLGLMDPKSMVGFTAGHTASEYCTKAVEYGKLRLSEVSANIKEYHTNLQDYKDGPIYLPTFVVYDWCNSLMSSTDKLSFVNAFIDGYQKRYSPKRLMLDNNGTIEFHYAMSILAFYNDSLSGSYSNKTYSQWQTEMYDWFSDIWVSQYIDTVNYLYGGPGAHEGPSYGSNVYMNVIFAMAAISTALGENYFTSMPFFKDYPLFLLANTKPLPEGGGLYYNNRWGDISGGISDFSCASSYLTTGVLKSLMPDYASLQKWEFQNASCNFPQYGGTWANALFYTFLWGNKEVTAKSPSQLGTALAQKLGQGEFVFRTGYENTSDTLIAFWATDWIIQPGGHSHDHIGHFTLEKFGNLILKPGNAKSPAGEKINNDQGALFHNVIGVHNPSDSSDTYMNYDKDSDDNLDDRATSYNATPNYQAGGANYKGFIAASDINNGKGYEYVSYDSSDSWLNKVSLSQREFAYLRGTTNNEFIVVFDRINAFSPSYEKKWHIWVPSQPTFVNGASVSEGGGKWTSANTNTMMVTNTYSGNNSHARMFVKALLPTTSKTTVIGGPTNNYFKDAKGNVVSGSIVYPLTAEQESRIGWGRIEFQPSVGANYDAFLNVIQFGDSNTLSSMSNTVKIDSTDGKMTGTHIKNSANQWLVMFVKNNTDVFNVASTAYTLDGMGTVNHLIVNLKKSKNYDIYDNGVKILTKTSTVNGVLNFSSNLGTAHSFSVTESGTVPDTTPPSNPTGLSVI